MGRMAEQHAIGGCQSEGIAGRFFPSEMFGARHQLARLHTAKLRERSVGRLITPDALAGGKHRIAAIALLVVAVILIAVNDDLVADFPAFHLAAHRPDNARGVRSGDMIGIFMGIEHRNRFAQGSPDPVVIDARRHHQNQHLVIPDGPCRQDFQQHRLFGRAVALFADRPCPHLVRHMSQRRNLANVIEVFHRGFRLHGQGLLIR